MNYKLALKEFDNHYKKYDFNDVTIVRNYYHSLRVMELSKLLAKYNNFNKDDIIISGIAGLLHDYACFEQWTKYKTLKDKNSIDHGDLAVKRLFDEEEINKYGIDLEYYDEIYDAIKYHNKIKVPEGFTKHNEMICKVVRDADKIDNFYLFSINKELFEEDDSLITKDIELTFFSGKQIRKTDIKNKNDRIILDLCMIFDLNFEYSLKYIDDNNLIWKMYDNIQNKKLFKQYFDFIDKYVKGRL